jgi:hypothetical protein
MTTMPVGLAPSTPRLPHRPFAARVGSIVRLILIDRWGFLYVPIIIVSSAFVMTIAVWMIVLYASNGQAADNQYPGIYLGGVQAAFWYLLAMSIQTVNRAFPLTMGLSVSRREFHAGFSVVLIMIPLAVAASYTVLSLIEQATNGWGISMQFFTTLGVYPWYETFLIYFAIVFFLMTVPSVFAAAYMRWKNTGVLVAFAILTVVLVGSIALITLNDWWPAVLTWIVAQGEIGMAAWSVLLSALALGGVYLVLRRATP